jgi:VWFA-related protein
VIPTRSLAVCLAVLLIATAATSAQSPPPEPQKISMKESVEVRLVTIDVVALDKHETTVPDMTKADFELYVDGKPTAIDTLDPTCEGGAQADPKSKAFGGWATPANLERGTRRIVLAFDYLHLTTMPCPDQVGPCLYLTRALENFQDVLERKTGIFDEQIMVVALTGGLRVEQPFTKDRQAVVDALHRMEYDVSLWNGRFDHLTEQPLFGSLRALVTVLRTVPGPKSVVFVSAGAGPGDVYDLDFEHLAAEATDAEVSFYPVDCMGLYAERRFT